MSDFIFRDMSKPKNKKKRIVTALIKKAEARSKPATLRKFSFQTDDSSSRDKDD
jgi:hypothetical protein